MFFLIPNRNNECFEIQSWKSIFQKLRGERVKGSTPEPL